VYNPVELLFGIDIDLAYARAWQDVMKLVLQDDAPIRFEALGSVGAQ